MKEINLTQGKTALVDDADFERINRHKWCVVGGRGYTHYAQCSLGIIGGKHVTSYMHRLILNLSAGDPKVDHRDRNGLNNQKNNLRLATDSQNHANRNKNQNTSTGFKGVYRNNERYQACIKVAQRKLYIGTYRTAREAALAYNIVAHNLFGEFARFNHVF